MTLVGDFLKLSSIRVRLSVKTIKDSGNDTISVASTGLLVNFNKTFLDVRSITVTPAYNASYPVTAVYDYNGASLPADQFMTVYLYRTDTGAKVTGGFSWKVAGV